MTTSETWVLCGGVTRRDAPADTIHLELGKDIRLDLAAIDRRFMGRISREFQDLIRIAAYVLAADSAQSRGDADQLDMGVSWHRRFRFVIGVEQPDFWRAAQTRDLLEDVLGFMADETYRFEFVQARKKPRDHPEQLTFTGVEGRPFVRNEIDDVVLFSGGLDSFAGAVDQMLRARRKVLLVSHKSSTKMWGWQRTLAQELRSLADQVKVPEPDQVAVTMTKHREELRVERTQRTRVLLFAAIAGAAARLLDRHRVLMFENAIVAVHLPIAGQLVGARATRTAHPKTLALLTALLGRVAGRPLRVENPFVFKTRAEILSELRETLAKGLMSQTVSCGYVHKQSSAHTHCGGCSQCIDRRFGVLGARAELFDPAENYALQLETGDWGDEINRALLLNYTGTAFRWAKVSTAEGLLEADGGLAQAIEPLVTDSMGRSAVAQALFEVHRRHATCVSQVVGQITARHIDGVVDGTLPKNSLPILMYEQGASRRAAANADHSVPQEPYYRFRFVDGAWHFRFRGGRPFTLPPMPGLQHIASLIRAGGRPKLPVELLAMEIGKPSPLASAALLDGVDETTLSLLRARVADAKRTRRQAAEFCDRDGMTELDDEIAVFEPLLAATKRTKHCKEPTKDQRDAMRRVRADVEEAVGAIRAHSRPLAAHLEENVTVEYICWYRASRLTWDLNETTGQDRSPPPAPAGRGVVLRVDLRKWAVLYRGEEIATGGRGLQPGSVLTLAALASRPRDVLSMSDIDRVIAGFAPPKLRRRGEMAPDARQLKYKIVSVMRETLPQLPESEIDGLITTVPRLGLRLNLDADQVEVVRLPIEHSTPSQAA